MYELRLPDLGEGIREAEILKWHVEPGERVEEDAPLVDVETDKAAVTIPSPKAGVLRSVAGGPGDVVVVGEVVAVIDTGEDEGAAPESVTPGPEDGAPDAVPRRPAGQERADAERTAAARVEAPAGDGGIERPAGSGATSSEPGGQGPVPAAPATRRLARSLGVDLAKVRPTGPGGRVTVEDVRRHEREAREAQEAAASPEGGTSTPSETVSRRASGVEADGTRAAPEVVEPSRHDGSGAAIPFYELEPMPDFERWGDVERLPLRSIRRKVARKMVTSMVVVPHVIHMDEADVTALEAFRRRYRETHPEAPKLNLLAFVTRAVAAGLKRWPMFNASLDPDRGEIVLKRYYNIGLAADTERGLVVPVLRQADGKSIAEIAAEIANLAEQARAGTLGVESFQGGTFTITNIGPLGGIALAPAINYPEVAILGMGTVQEKPVVRDGEVVIRKMLPLTLSFDHRVADCGDAARFMGFLVRLLSDPDALLVEV